MNRQTKFSRKDFLRYLFHPLKQIAAANNYHPAGDEKDIAQENYEPDCLASLPPEFDEAMLREEVKRLGGKPDVLTQNQMAELVLQAMQGQRTQA